MEICNGMSESTPEPAPPRALARRHRRVLGVLIEKAFCTPENYPLTVNSLVAGCNQKSNRDPVTELPSDVVEEALQELQQFGLTTRVLPASGRTERWKHNSKETWQLDRPQRAILAELLLRGPQTEGDLRVRASRMVEVPTLEELRVVLDSLAARGFVRLMSPEGRKRGRIWSHLLFPPEEWTQVEERLKTMDTAEPDEPAPRPTTSAASSSIRSPASDALAERLSAVENELEQTKIQIAELRQQLERLSAENQEFRGEIRSLRSELGG